MALTGETHTIPDGRKPSIGLRGQAIQLWAVKIGFQSTGLGILLDQPRQCLQPARLIAFHQSAIAETSAAGIAARRRVGFSSAMRGRLALKALESET